MESHPEIEAFDFIVVGGGTAGLVVAARLSEDPSVQIAIIEAGKNELDNPRIHTPGNWYSCIGSQDLDWNFTAVPQPGMYDRAPGQPAGKVLGGSSAINGLAFIAPSKATVDAWASLGNPGWTWDELIPYYKKFHTLKIPDPKVKRHLHLDYLDGSAGTHGPVKAYYATPLSEALAPAWSATFENLGFAPSGDPASGVATGGFSSPASVDGDTKERSYSAPAYWRPASSRPNIRLFTEATVEKVNLEQDGEGITATGVVFSTKQGKTTLKARKEVIVSAGVFQSPKILELSGIGDPDLLERHGIKTVIANKAVGENLQDHLMTGISYEVNDDVDTLDSLRSKDPIAVQIATDAYEKNKDGPFSWGGINYFSYMPIIDPSASDDSLPFAKEIAANPAALDAGENKGLALQYDFIKSVLQSKTEGSGGIYLSPRGTTYGASMKASDYSISTLPGKYITIALSLLLPLSRGNVHISSAEATADPRIDPKYLDNPLDVEIAASHLAFIEKIAQTKPLADFIKPGGRRNSPLARGDDRAVAKEWVRRSVLSNWHGCGSCSMMPKKYGGVVNERLLVHGAKNLRVIDASVIPIVPRGNTQSSVYMIAEKAADLIKEDHNLQK